MISRHRAPSLIEHAASIPASSSFSLSPIRGVRFPRHAFDRGDEVGIALEPLPRPAGAVEFKQMLVVFGIAPIGARTYAGRGILLCHANCFPLGRVRGARHAATRLIG